MAKRMILTWFLILLAGFPAFAKVEGIIAVVNDEVITQKDLDEFASFMYLQHSGEYKDRKELESEMQKWRQEAVDKIVEERLMIQEAKKEKIEIPPRPVERRLEEIKKQFASSEEFENTLLAEGLNINDLKHKITEQLMMDKIVEKEVKDKISVSPTEVTAYYQGHKDEIKVGEQAEVDSIFVPFEDSESIAQAKTQEALDALNKGADFAETAKKYSYSPSVGKVARGSLKKDIEEVIFKLKIGEYSKMVKTDTGFYIFKLLNLIPARQLDLKEVNQQIEQIILIEKFSRRYEQWIGGLKDKAYINVK